MSKKNISSFIILALLVTLIISGTGCSRQVQGEDTKVVEENYVAVETKKAAMDMIGNTTRFSGRVVANEEVMVMPKLVGTVKSVNVKLGDKVVKDTILFTLDQADIHKGIEQTEISINSAKRNVDQASNAVKSATINYEMSKERIDKAKVDLDRTKRLFEQGAVSKTQLEQAELAASDKQLEIAQGQIAQAEISLQQAQNQLLQAELSYEQAKSNLDNTVVKAPMDGIVSVLNVKEGQIATNGQAAAIIVDVEKVYIQLNVVENLVNRLQLGQEAMVNIPAALNEEVGATIDYISPTADARSQLYPVKVYMNNPNETIRPGMNGEVGLSVDQVESALVINSNAVLDKNGDKIVFVVENDQAIERIVTLGLDTGDYVEIKDGIKSGDEVIVKGQHYVEDGLKVKVVRGE